MPSGSGVTGTVQMPTEEAVKDAPPYIDGHINVYGNKQLRGLMGTPGDKNSPCFETEKLMIGFSENCACPELRGSTYYVPDDVSNSWK